MITKTLKCALVILAIAITQLCYGQSADKKSITHQHLLWFRYFNKLTLSDRWQINTQVEERTYFSPWEQHQFTARTQLIYKIDSVVSISQGFVYMGQNTPQDPEAESHFLVPELRPFQEVIIKNDLSKKLKLQHRFKLEERFFRNNDPKTEELESGYTFNFRARYQAQFQYVFFKKDNDQSLRLVVADEIMVNFGDKIIYNSFDQNRFTLGLAYDFNTKFGIEVNYINWFQQRSSGDEYYNRHIGRLTFYHNIDLSKKK